MRYRIATLSLLALSACFEAGDDTPAGDEIGTDSGESSTSMEESESTESASTTGEGDTTSESTSETTTGDPDECSETELCAAPIPEGWQGPVAYDFAPIGQSPSCGANYSMTVSSLFAGFGVGPSECDCECDVVGASCPTSGTLQIWDNAGCNGGPQHSVALSIPCTSVTGNLPASLSDDGGPSAPLADDWFGMAPSPIQGGSCEAIVTSDFSAAEFDLAYTLCESTSTPAACAISEGICVPVPDAPLELGICVWQAGDVDCPADAYTNKTLLHAGIEDTRDCSTCQCGSPQGSCNSSIQLQELNDGECVDYPYNITPGDCTGSGFSDIELATYNPGTPNATCNGPGTTQVQGEATPTGAVTLCCSD